MKPTPGPWILGNENNECADVTAGRTSISLSRHDIHTGELVISREEMLANWHLVAASRELLSVLEQLLKLDKLDQLDEHEPELHAAARAALKKARGQ